MPKAWGKIVVLGLEQPLAVFVGHEQRNSIRGQLAYKARRQGSVVFAGRRDDERRSSIVVGNEVGLAAILFIDGAKVVPAQADIGVSAGE